MVNIHKAIQWWENDLNGDNRNKIFSDNLGKGKSWSDIGDNNKKGIKKRHKWLLKMYKKYYKKYSKG